MVERLSSIIRPGATVAILGLAYKPFTQVVEESQGLYLANALSEAGMRVIAYDPLAGDQARRELRDDVSLASSLAECLAEAEMILITTPDPAFLELRASDFNRKGTRVTVVDFWRSLGKELAKHPNVDYVPIGRGIMDAENAARLAEMWGDIRAQ